MKWKKGKWIPVLCVCLLFLFVGSLLGWRVSRDTVNENELALLQAYRSIEEYFVGDYDETEHLQATLEAMVDSLGDRWSYYLTPEQAQRVKETRDNTYVGIGVTVDQETEDGLCLLNVTEGGPAEAAGLQAGEIIRSVDGIVITPETREEAVSGIRGEEGTTVTLEVEGTDGAVRQVEVTRQTIHSITATWTIVEGQPVGLITIENFYEGTADLVRQGTEELQAQGAKALVIDVRNNPGGYVTEVTDVLDILLPEGTIFMQRDYNGKEEVYTSDANCVDLPMAVLVNKDSYSAAEILAAQLQESVGAVLVGEQTSGKGYSQVLLDLADGSAIGLSTARYYTGSGVSLIGTGLTPDPLLSLSEEKQALLLLGDLPLAEDDQLQAAVKALGFGE